MLSQSLLQRASRAPAIIAKRQIRLQGTTTTENAAKTAVPASSAISVPFELQTEAQAREQLAHQRLKRPVSPHLGIYKWQVHSVASAMQRNTGILFSGPLYIFGVSYLAAPYLGWDLSSAALAASFASWPIVAQMITKFALAWPFTFHVVNAVNNLVATTGWTLTSKARFIQLGWLVVGTSLVSAVGLVAYF